MSEYKVKVDERVITYFTVHADTEEEAQEIAAEVYCTGMDSDIEPWYNLDISTHGEGKWERPE